MSSETNQTLPPGGDDNRLKDDTPDFPRPKADLPKRPARHPLTSFGLSNFKAFGAAEQTIPLRPITLAFGPNSGGKSSLLHFLLWMKDVVEGKGLDVYHPTAGGHSVDLGGFKQIRHGNNAETALSVKLQLHLKDGRGHDRSLQSISMFAASAPPADYVRRLKALVAERFAEILARNSLEKLAAVFCFLDKFVIKRALTRLLTVDHGEFTVERLLDDYEEGSDDSITSWEKLREDNCPGLQVLHQSDVGGAPVIVDGLGNVVVTKETSHRFTADELIAELQTLAVAVLKTLKLQPPPGVAEMKPSLIRFELSEHGVPVFCAAPGQENSLTVQHVDAPWLTEFSQVKGAGSSLLVSEEDFALTAKGMLFNNLNSWLPQEPLFVPQPPGLDSSATQKRVLDHLIGSSEVPGLLPKCQAAAERQCAALSYLGPLRAYPARTMTVAELPQVPDPEGLFAWRQLYERADVREAVNDWLNQASLTSRYEILVDHRVSLENTAVNFEQELHRTISRMKQNVADLFEVNQKQGWPRDKPDPLNEAYETLQGWDHLASIREAVEAAKARMASQSSGIVYLKDRRTGKHVTSRDIGVGMSQLIPVLVHAKAAHDKIIAIEQPEIHIHPALQAELGDVFIESALKQGNTFLIETHSEHLILRIMRRIRETARGKLPDGKQPIRPEDVCILYVEPAESGSIVREMPLNERGELVKAWPGGFFEESFNELF